MNRFVFASSLILIFSSFANAVPQDKRFKDFEIRVIRPKFFFRKVRN